MSRVTDRNIYNIIALVWQFGWRASLLKTAVSRRHKWGQNLNKSVPDHMKDCLVNFFSLRIVPDTFGYSAFVYAKQVGQGCEVCTRGKVPNTHHQLYGQVHACVLFGFAAVAVSQRAKRKCDHNLSLRRHFERYCVARCEW